ncbi:hypothetical protein SLW70_04195 [Flavobacterium sp. NG2]|uniref:hypothetical protein n=1 Tax=Flavobacterium sp. NG2 TaxID=3097547 RepID=UPI002A82CC69|nr:hypothetical protein [Flavobacterium sp. NG2]WPR72349.1 hypothetical protein SLW70_04195 [Flavobacterium sp. NG2]
MDESLLRGIPFKNGGLFAFFDLGRECVLESQIPAPDRNDSPENGGAIFTAARERPAEAPLAA